MKKKLALALAATLTIGLFAGCAAQNNQGGDTQRGDTQGGDTQGQDVADRQYTDGTYEGVGQGYNGDIRVRVEVADGNISNIEVLEQQETTNLGDKATETVAARIVETQSTEVEVVSGATGSSNGTMEAVRNALEGQ